MSSASGRKGRRRIAWSTSCAPNEGGRSQVDGLRSVPDLSGALLPGGNQQVPIRLRGDDEELLRLPGFRNQDELHFPALHGFSGLRVKVVVPDISTAVDPGADVDLARLRPGEHRVAELP